MILQQRRKAIGIAVNSSDHVPLHGNYLAFFKNTEITQLEEGGAQTFDDAKRKRAYDRIQEIEVHGLPYYVIRWSELTDMRTTALTGVKPPVIGSTFRNVAEWSFR